MTGGSIGAGWCGLLVAFATAGAALAQSDYPKRTIRIIVPTAPAGGNDTVGRVIAQGLTERWGKQVVVDNRAGASTMIGGEMVAKRPRTEEQVPRGLTRGCDPEAGCGAGLKPAVVMRAFTVASPQVGPLLRAPARRPTATRC